VRKQPENVIQANPTKTRSAVRDVVADIRDAVRPEKKSAADILSWLVAASAASAVLWRSIHAPAEPADLAGGGRSLGQAPPRKEPRHDDSSRDGKAVKSRDLRADNARAAARRGEDDRDKGALGRVESGSQSETQDPDEKCAEPVTGFGPMAKELWCRFQSSECMTRANALAFIGVLSLGPVLLFALAALGFVIHDAAQVETFVHGLVGRLLPGRQATEAANNLIAQTHILESARTLMKGKWWAVSIGVISILWAADGLFAGAADAMNAAWGVKETRPFWKLRLVSLGVFLGAGVLFLLSLVPSSLPNLAKHIQLPVIGSIPGFLLDTISWLLAIVIDAAMFTVIYRFLPNAKVPWKSAMFAGAIAGLLWELFKQAFAVYIAHFANFDKLYGTLGGAVLLVTWILYSCVVLLACAIACKMHNEHVNEGGVVGSGK